MPKFFVAQPLGYSVQTGEIDNLAVTEAKLAANAVTSAKIKDDEIVNADIKTSAAIAFSKLSALASANILLGNASNVAAAVALTGDVAITNAGLTTVTDLTITSEAQGDILYFNGSNWVRLAKGTAAQVLAMNGGATAPEWVAAAGGGKDIVTAVATWSTEFTGSTQSYVDITNATVTISGLDAGKTYTLVCLCDLVDLRHSSENAALIKLLINGVESGNLTMYPSTYAAIRVPCMISAIQRGVTGSTSYIAKAQVECDDGSVVINDTLKNAYIAVIALEE